MFKFKEEEKKDVSFNLASLLIKNNTNFNFDWTNTFAFRLLQSRFKLHVKNST